MNTPMFIVKIIADAIICAFVIGIIIYALMCNNKAEDEKDSSREDEEESSK